MSTISSLLELIKRDDPNQIEAARNQITPTMLPALVKAYRKLPDWPRKLAMINLIQDHISPVSRPVMKDILRAPESLDPDYVQTTKAVALCHLESDFDRFVDYHQDRRLLASQVEKYRRQEEQRKSSTGKGPASSRLQQLLTILATVAMIVGPLIMTTAYFAGEKVESYHNEGIQVSGKVYGKRSASRKLCVSVSYFDKPLLQGGKLHRNEGCEFNFGENWSGITCHASVTIGV